MIDPDVMVQIRALSEENQALRRELNQLSLKLDANSANLKRHFDAETAQLRDPVARATERVLEFGGRLDEFEVERDNIKKDYEWWTAYFERISKIIEERLKDLRQAQDRLAQDNQSFKAWAIERINQIGRIFRR